MTSCTWDGTVEDATRIINWALELDGTATWDDAEPEAVIRITHGLAPATPNVMRRGDTLTHRRDGTFKLDRARRTANIHLSLEALAQFLDIPEGLRPVFIYADPNTQTAALVVEGDSLEPVQPGCAIPSLPGSVSAEVLIDDDGKQWRRMNWEPTANPQGV